MSTKNVLIELKLNENGRKLIIDPDRITGSKITELSRKLLDVRQKASKRIFLKYPKQPFLPPVTEDPQPEREETDEEWYKRIASELEKEVTKNEDESDQDYLDRVNQVNMETHIVKEGYDVCKAIREVFGQPDFTEKDFDPSIPAMKEFIYDVFTQGGLAVDAKFFPNLRAKDL